MPPTTTSRRSTRDTQHGVQNGRQNRYLRPDVDIVQHLVDICEIDFTREQVQTLLDDNEDLVSDIDEWGYWDTEVRGRLASMVTRHLLGRRWPTYGDKVDIDQFVEDLKAAGALKGYKPLSTEKAEQ